MTNNGFFHGYVEECRLSGTLPIQQPRMGFSNVPQMQRGLNAVRNLAGFSRVGTITLDAMTRQGMLSAAEAAIRVGAPLNGFPIITHGAEVTRTMLDGVQDQSFPIQVRHGSPLPQRIFAVAHAAGIDATEGGPISYCLPYGRVPLAKSMEDWSEAVTFWAEAGKAHNRVNHLESFAGCMMGQLNPPDIRIAISILEGQFFVERGIRSVSLSHSQGTNFSQDVGSVLALRRLAREYLPQDVGMHIVLYTWMGVFPETADGAQRLIEDSGVIAAITGAERVIVKTVVEAFQIPTIEDNVRALQWVANSAKQAKGLVPNSQALEHAETIYAQAKGIIDAVLHLNSRLDRAMLRAFQNGILDVPFCFHPDNRNEARAALDPQTGIIGWERAGRVPVPNSRRRQASMPLTSDLLLKNLTFNKHKYDEVY